jgi:hypothetical protein
MMEPDECTDPECTREESDHAASETGFFTLGGYAFINALSKPHIGLHVPRIKEDFEVRWELDIKNFHIRCALPE